MNDAERAPDLLETARIFGGPLAAVHQTIARHNIGWLVSAINADTMLETPEMLIADRHLKLAMNDISSEREGLVLPSDVHVARLIEFVKQWDQRSPMMIHCWAGVSRSTAGVFIALCQLNEQQAEAEIAGILRTASPTATPNLKLVELADDLLGRQGRMVEAIVQIGQGEMTMEGAVFSLPAQLGDG